MAVQAHLEIDSRVDELAHARDWMRVHAQAAGFDARIVRELSLVVSEACANVIKHAYCGEPNHPITIDLTIDTEQLVLWIHDQGEAFDLGDYHPPDLDEPHEHGYGVFLIRSLMDEVRYHTSDGPGTTLELVRYRRQPAAGGGRDA